MPGTLLLDDWQNAVTDRLQQHARDTLQAVQQANQPPLQAVTIPTPQIDPNEIVQRLQQHGQSVWDAVQQANQPPFQGVQAPQIDPNDITQRLQQHAQDAFQSIDQNVQSIGQGFSNVQQAVQPAVQAAQGVQQGLQEAQQAVQPATQANVDRGGDLHAYARQAANRAGIDPDIFERQIQQESGFNTTAKSGAGALGIAQFMPATAAGMGVDPSDPYAALDGAAQLMAANLKKYGGDYGKALAAYNAGPGNVDKYGGIPPFEETQRYVSTILDGAKAAVQGAVEAGKQAVQNILPSVSQFGDKQLTAAEAYAACGPAAAVRFAQAFGRNPTLREATDLAAKLGWTSDTGMAGLQSESKLFTDMGIPHRVVGADWQALAREAASGNPVTISTPGHYFTADSYDPSSGAFHVGSSGTDLRGGAEWMTPSQMEARMGSLQGGLAADNPGTPAPSPISGGTTAVTGLIGQARQAVQQGGRAIAQGLQSLDRTIQDVSASGPSTGAGQALASFDQGRQQLADQISAAPQQIQDAFGAAVGPGSALATGSIGDYLPTGAIAKTPLGGALDTLRGPMLLTDEEVLRTPEAETARRIFEDSNARAVAKGEAPATMSDADIAEATRALLLGHAVAMTGEGLGRPTAAKPSTDVTPTAPRVPTPIRDPLGELVDTVPQPEGKPGVTIENATVDGRASPSLKNVVFRDADGQPRGVLQMFLGPDGQPTNLTVAVDPDFQRQGIATGLYQVAEKAGFDVNAASGAGGRTIPGELLASSRARGERPPFTIPAEDTEEGVARSLLPADTAATSDVSGSPGPAPNVVGGTQSGQISTQLAARLGGAAAGGYAGYQTTPEDASPAERIARTAAGAGAGVLAAGTVASAARFRGTTDQHILDSLRSAGLVAGPARAAPPWRGVIPEAVEGTKQLLLTSPTTHIGNVIGNTIELARQPVALALGGRADDALAGITSVAKALPQAAANALEALRGTQLATLSTEAANIPRRQPIYRALSAADAFTRTLAEYQGMSSEANRLLREASISPGDPAAQTYLASHAADLFRAGARDGAQAVFAQAGATVGAGGPRRVQNVFQVYSRWKEGLLASPDRLSQGLGAFLDLQLPFSGVPSRLLSIAVNRTPPGAQIGGAWRMGRALQAGDTAAAQRAFGETVMESAIEFLIAKNIQDGNIRGPDDAEHPNGINVPGMGWVDTRELGGYALPMQLMASWAEGWQKGGQNIPAGEDPTLPRFNAAFNASMVPFMRAVPGVNMIQLLSTALQGNVTGAATQEAQSLISRLTAPGAARFFENATDPLARDVAKKGIAALWEPTMAAWPGLAERLPVKIDPTTGEPMQKARSGLGTLVGQQQDVVSPLTVEADRLNKAGFKDVTAPKTYPDKVSIAGADVQLKPDEQRKVTEITGKQLGALAERLNQPDYQNSTDTRKAQLMQAYVNAVDKARVAAVRDVLGVDELRNRIAQGEKTVGRLNVQAPSPSFVAPFLSSSSQSAQEQQAVGAGR